MNLENDVPKYKKKKKSTTSKSSEKTKHKHEYTEKCIVKYPTPHLLCFNINYNLAIATYCKHCGKIDSVYYPMTDDFIYFHNGLHSVNRHMTNEEILEYYKDLEIVDIDNCFQKYLPISKGDD